MKNIQNEIQNIIETKFGTCTLICKRSDGFHVLEPTNWILSNDSRPKFYFNEDNFKVTISNESNMEKEESNILKSYKLKAEGGLKFKAGDYSSAKLKYWESLYCLENLGKELNFDKKAEILELTINIHNNISLCCMKTNDFAGASTHALNSYRLIEAVLTLESKASPLLEALLQRKNIVNIDHIRKLWKRKALYYAGKADLLRKNYKEAISYFEQAISLIDQDPLFKKDLDELKIHYNQAKLSLKKVNKREKDMYSKIFSSSKCNESENEVHSKEKLNSYYDDKISSRKNNIEDDNRKLPYIVGILGVAIVAIGFVLIIRRRK